MTTVLHSVPRYWLPLTESWLYSQVRFSSPFVENHIVCWSTMNLDQFFVPNIHAYDQASGIRYLCDKGLRKLRLRRYPGHWVVQGRSVRAAILHSHFGPAGYRDMRAVAKLGVKHVVTFYGYDISFLPANEPRWYRRYQGLFKTVDRVLCEGPHMAKEVANLGCPCDKIIVHHLGVNLQQIEFKPRRWDHSRPLRVLIAAAFREKKGIPYALEALARIHRKTPVQVTIVGDTPGGSNGAEEKRKILDVIQKHRLGPAVRLLGFQPHDALLREAYDHDIFLSPSVTAANGDTEGGAPVGLIEMAATGMPVVSTSHCDIPEVIQHERTGLLARERDVEGLVSHLRRLVTHPELWRPMVERARRRIEQEFNAKVQGERLAVIYEDLAARHDCTDR